MKTRILTAAVGIPLVLLALALFDTAFFDFLLLVITMIAVYEIISAFQIPRKNILLFAALPVSAVCFFREYTVCEKLFYPFLFAFILILAGFVLKYFQEINITALLAALSFSAIVIVSFYSIVHFKMIFPAKEYGYFSVLLILMVLSYAWGGDSMAYFMGRRFGKRKLAPVISPKKTVEGAYGSVIGSVLLGEILLVVYYGLEQNFASEPMLVLDWKICLLVGLVAIPASLLGIMGDLFASCVKRQMKIKDYGNILPGHGGILDRFDSVLFIAPFVSLCAPLFYHCFV